MLNSTFVLNIDKIFEILQRFDVMGKYLNSLHTISFTLKKSTYTQSGIFFQLPQNIAPEVRTKYKATVLFCQTFMKCVLLCLHFGKKTQIIQILSSAVGMALKFDGVFTQLFPRKILQ